jgi:hypothetical protein
MKGWAELEVALDLPAEMVAQVNEVGESRRRERETKE